MGGPAGVILALQERNRPENKAAQRRAEPTWERKMPDAPGEPLAPAATEFSWTSLPAFSVTSGNNLIDDHE